MSESEIIDDGVLFNYSPRSTYYSRLDPIGWEEEPCCETFVVKRCKHDNRLTDEWPIKFVSGNKEAWDKMGHTNRVTAKDDELIELSDLELILHRTKT